MKASSFTLLVALIAMSLTPCHAESFSTAKANPSRFVTDSAKRAMITSLEELDRNRFYLMNYTVDYQLDQVLQANAASQDSVDRLLQRLLYDVSPRHAESLQFGTGCSAYAATLYDSAQYLMGRNYDFCHMEGKKEAPATAIVLFTAPEGGKKSINFVDAYWLGFHSGFYNDDTTDISALMFAPYLILDGMNEDGLAIGVLHLDGKPTEQNVAGMPDIYTSVAMRAVLDRCSTVDSAINFFRGYNMHMATPASGSLHFMLADAEGDYAIVEWSFADPMHVDSTSVPTVFTVLQADTNRYVTNFYVDPRLNNCKYGGLSMHGRDRYNTLRDTLQTYNYELTSTQSRTLLQAVAQDPNPAKPTSHTQWSNVYNLSRRTISTAILQEFARWYEFTVTGLISKPTGLEQEDADTSSSTHTTKLLKDGQLLIMSEDEVYNAQGSTLRSRQ